MWGVFGMKITKIIHRLTLILMGFMFHCASFALPGDVLFSDDFERVNIGPNWTTTNATFSAIGNQTSNSNSRSLYTRHGAVTTTGPNINLSGKFAKVEMWIRKGSDTFSENPDGGENFIVEYLNNSNNWISLDSYLGGGTQGQIFLLDEQLPSDALHSGFRLRVRLTAGSGNDFDYWHLDDVIVTETGFVPPPPPLAVGGCDNFEGNLNNWTINASGGSATISSSTAQSPDSSLDLSAGVVSATSIAINTSSNFQDVTVWVRRGSDAFSENPEANENFIIEYLNASNNWVILETFLGAGTQGEIFNRTYPMPVAAQHPNFRLRLRMLAASGGNFDHWHVDDVCLVPGVVLPEINLQKISTVINDGINTTNPKRIPGALIDYDIIATNSGLGSTDNNTVVLADAVPANTALYVNDISGPGTGPVRFVDGTPPSGLSYNFIGLASSTDDVSFSSDGGVTYNYSPVADADGLDGNVTHIRISTQGAFLADSGSGSPNFLIKFRVKVE